MEDGKSPFAKGDLSAAFRRDLTESMAIALFLKLSYRSAWRFFSHEAVLICNFAGFRVSCCELLCILPL